MYVCESEHTVTINTLSIKINHYANTFYYNMHHTNRTVINNNNFYVIVLIIILLLILFSSFTSKNEFSLAFKQEIYHYFSALDLGCNFFFLN